MKVILVLLIVAIFVLAMVVISNTRKMSNRINKLESYHNDEIIMIKNLIKSRQSDKETLIKIIDAQTNTLKFIKDKDSTIANFMETLINQLKELKPKKTTKKVTNK